MKTPSALEMACRPKKWHLYWKLWQGSRKRAEAAEYALARALSREAKLQYQLDLVQDKHSGLIEDLLQVSQPHAFLIRWRGTG